MNERRKNPFAPPEDPEKTKPAVTSLIGGETSFTREETAEIDHFIVDVLNNVERIKETFIQNKMLNNQEFDSLRAFIPLIDVEIDNEKNNPTKAGRKESLNKLKEELEKFIREVRSIPRRK